MAAIASRRPWMPWLCEQTWTPSSVHTARPALGAMEAWARNGREYDASTTPGPGPGAPSSSRTGTSSWVPDRSQAARSSASGSRSRSSHSASAAELLERPVDVGLALADHPDEGAVAHQRHPRHVGS